MKISASEMKIRMFSAVLLLALSPGIVLAQTNGSRYRNTLTFANSASGTATLTFKVQATNITAGAASLPTTSLTLELGKDGDNSMTPMAPGVALTFTLKQRDLPTGGPPPAYTTVAGPFTPTTLPTSMPILGGTREITMSQPFPTAGPGLFTLNIVHTAPSAGTTMLPDTNWQLDVGGLPTTSSPAVRGNAALSGRNEGFIDLAPVGTCGGGATCPPCPPCSNIAVVPKWYYKEIPIKWFPPPPPPDCPVCGKWLSPIPDGYERTLVSLAPTSREGKFLGAGKAPEIKLNINGGEAVGDLVDMGSGEYLQLVQYRTGSPPTVSATAAGVPSEEVVAGIAGVAPIYRTLTYVLALVVLVLAGGFYNRGRTLAGRG